MLAILLTAAAAGTLTDVSSNTLIDRYGTGVYAVLDGRVWTLVTANYFVDHPAAMFSSVTLVAIFVGIYEFRFGLRWTVAVWFLGTLAATIIAAVVWHAVSFFISVQPIRDVATAEVGSSAACWCALGAWVGWPAEWTCRQLVVGLGATGLLAAFLVAGRTFTDVEHFASFGFGVLFFGWVQRHRRPTVHVYTGSWLAIGYLLAALAGLLTLIAATIAAGGWQLMVLICVGLSIITAGLFGSRVLWPYLTGAVLCSSGLALAVIWNIAILVVAIAAAALTVYGARWPEPSVGTSVVLKESSR